jgi:ketosteroid isomerase-like protein
MGAQYLTPNAITPSSASHKRLWYRRRPCVASFYARDGIAFPPDEAVAVGSSATKRVWAKYFADPTYQISWKTTSAEVVKDLGWTAGTFQDSSKGADGKTVAKTGKYVCVWHHGADAKWKAIRDIWNYD